MPISNKYVFPAFLQKGEGVFGVYFPTLFPEHGWEFPLSQGRTKSSAINAAQRELAYCLAGFLYDNEEIPSPIPIQKEQLSKGMEIIEVETSFEPYAEQIKEHLRGRHWHISYYDDKTNTSIEAIGFKNKQGMWDIYYIDDQEEAENDEQQLLFTVKHYKEAEEKFFHFVETKIVSNDKK
ncbi:type II toxin-antitoxin system HicB family antitoxin [Bacillus sp. B1-b2]|uniref:type II toxin-antitoxin system HicB family antitoxin n=1 Tax=Bacillus sp. B1-b2 TaxID=2653201 RepID=UPI0012626FC8|nr:type II toxin-antitoxin system HicB family antitoxin [Bacillus sp. B1-b2]KAB7672043.1 type II toxin-antitoxin system HicB family antitoxin [Bacillus sp. B1-b2]